MVELDVVFEDGSHNTYFAETVFAVWERVMDSDPAKIAKVVDYKWN